MNNEELKKKIVEIINDGIIHGEDNFGMPTSKTIENIADALIEAGLNFGPVVSHTATFDIMQLERINRLEIQAAETEHRAEVAERALESACEDVKELVSFLIELSERVDGLRVENYLPEECEAKAYLQRAEKELAEEEKND